jgi:hypothetical protein
LTELTFGVVGLFVGDIRVFSRHFPVCLVAPRQVRELLLQAQVRGFARILRLKLELPGAPSRRARGAAESTREDQKNYLNNFLGLLGPSREGA